MVDMKVVIAPDKFKDALDAQSVGQSIKNGICRFDSSIETIVFPVSDGGEGLAELLTFHGNGKVIEVEVNGPLFEKVRAKYGLSEDGNTAYMEMAQASGLQLVAPGKRNCMFTSTYGTGEMIIDAYRKGARRIIMGIGGSATNDAGIGMATALGFKMIDKKGNELKPIGSNLAKITSIRGEDLKINPDEMEVSIACDVGNPLYGKNGAAHVYASQKGASLHEIEELDIGLRNFSGVVKNMFNMDVAGIPGSGAAGGLGAGCMVFLGGRLMNGIDLFLKESGFGEVLDGCNLVITGEGKIDAQTFQGKAIHGVCQFAARKDIPVAALCGKVETSTDDISKIGLSYLSSVSRGPSTLDEALKSSSENLEFAAYNLMKIFMIKRSR